MKKIVAVLTAFLLIFTSCDSFLPENIASNISLPNSLESKPGDVLDIEKEGQKVDEPVKIISTPDVQSNVRIESNHKKIEKSGYYGYGLLSESERIFYDRLDDSVKHTQNFVNISDLDLSVSSFNKTYNYFVADNPAYFWLSKKSYYQYNSRKVLTVGLKFYDGVRIDEYVDNRMELDKNNAADRNRISAQISELNAKLSGLVGSVPYNYSELQKARMAHNLTIDNLSYNYEEAKKVGKNDYYSHIFTVYGGIVQNSGVCEAYSKMFQMLCYELGINAITVRGESKGEGHMWNAALIGDSWYYQDTTWDDGYEDAILPKNQYYKYFNLTGEMMLKDHTVTEAENFPMPAANSTEFYYLDMVSPKIHNKNESPADLAQTVGKAKMYGDIKYTLRFSEEFNAASVRTYLNNFRGQINNEVKKQNGTLEASYLYIELEQYVVLTITW